MGADNVIGDVRNLSTLAHSPNCPKQGHAQARVSFDALDPHSLFWLTVAANGGRICHLWGRSVKLSLVLYGLIAVLLCARDSSAAFAFFYTSSATSWVGHGETRSLTPATNNTFHANRNLANAPFPNEILFSVGNTTNADSWTLDFVGPNNALATVGDYQGALRSGFQGSQHPGLAFGGNGRGDNQLTGNFQVLEASFDNNGQVVSYAVNFWQYDEGVSSAWNFGALRFNSSVPVPEPAALISAAAGTTALSLRRRRKVLA